MHIPLICQGPPLSTNQQPSDPLPKQLKDKATQGTAPRTRKAFRGFFPPRKSR